MQNRVIGGVALAAAVCLGLEANAQDPATEDTALDPRAFEIAIRAVEHIAASPGFVVEEEASWDVLQDDGRMLEYGATRTVSVRRPDRVRADIVSREEGVRGLRFDGERITLFDPEAGVYAWVPFRGSLGAALDLVTDNLQTPVPNTELLYDDAPEILREVVDSAALVDEVAVRGTPCHHVSLRAGETDAQLWVQRDGDPILHRLVLTYKHEPGMPQFRAHFVEWKFGAELDDGDFAFEPPDHAERIPFVVRRVQEETAE